MRRAALGPAAALVISYALGLVPLVDERIVSVRRRGDVALEQPARVGDRLHVEGTIDAVEAMDDETGLVHMTWNVVTQTRQPVARMEVDALWHRGSELGSSCQEQDCVKRESAAALPS
jgi:acyl dehydratase